MIKINYERDKPSIYLIQGTYPSCHRVRAAVHLGQVISLSQGQHREMYPCMFLDCGKKSEYPERTHCEATVLTTAPPNDKTINVYSTYMLSFYAALFYLDILSLLVFYFIIFLSLMSYLSQIFFLGASNLFIGHFIVYFLMFLFSF